MNRHTDQLNDLDCLDEDCILWLDIKNSLSLSNSKIRALNAHIMDLTGDTYQEVKILLLCFMSHMTDQELLEVFGI